MARVYCAVEKEICSGMVKGCGHRVCALLCLCSSWIKLSMAASVPVYRLTVTCDMSVLTQDRGDPSRPENLQERACGLARKCASALAAGWLK